MNKKIALSVLIGLVSLSLSSCNFSKFKKGFGDKDTSQVNDKKDDSEEKEEESIEDDASPEDEESSETPEESSGQSSEQPAPQINSYKITWKNWDNSFLYESTVNEGVEPSYPAAAPELQKPDEGYIQYSFVSWSPSIVAAYSNATYVATYRGVANKIKVNWLNDAGTIIDTEYINKGYKITNHVSPSKSENPDEYVFDYWKDDVYGVLSTTQVLDGNIYEYNFKPYYKFKEITVTFEDYNLDVIKTVEFSRNSYLGSESNLASFPTEATMNARAANRKNDRYTYKFVGWSIGAKAKENDLVKDSTTQLYPEDSREGQTNTNVSNLTNVQLTTNLTLHAEYELTLNKYTVNFYGKDKNELLGTTKVSYGSSPKWSDYSFTDPQNYTATEGGLTKAYYWDGNFKYKFGDTYKVGFTTVTSDLDYFASYNDLVGIRGNGAVCFTNDINDFSVAIRGSSSSVVFTGFEYCKDNEDWQSYTFGTTIQQSKGHYIFFRKSGSIRLASSCDVYAHIALEGYGVKMKGYIENLLNYKKVVEEGTFRVGSYGFANLLANETELIEGPSFISKTYEWYALYNTFSGCTNLVKMGDMEICSADVVCFYKTFFNCTSLINGPKFNLNTTNLGESCFTNMFQYCSSLTSVEGNIKFAVAAKWAMESMFEGCSSLTTAPKIDFSGSEMLDSCFNKTFKGCAALTKIDFTGSITKIGASSFESMCEGCTALTKPLLIFNATEVGAKGLKNLYYNCSSLKFSSTCSGLYTERIRFPNQSGTSTTIGNQGLYQIFTGTGGEYTNNPSQDVDYYYIP